MIPMSCPSCGRRGNVPLDRLNTRMHCKKCDAVFHLDATGKPVLGEPAPPKGSKGKGGRDKNEPLDPIGIVAGKLAHIPKPIWMTLLVVFAGWFLWGAFQRLKPGPATPEQNMTLLLTRATDAFLNRDVATLKGMSASGTEEDTAKTVEEIRPIVGNGGSTSEGLMVAPGEPLFHDEQNMSAVVTLLPVAGGSSFDLHWAWARDVEGRWSINGKITYDLNKDEVSRLAARKKR